MNIISPVKFISKLVKQNEQGQPFKLFPFQEEILNLAFAFDENGKLPYDAVIYSTVKKSGKTTLNAALTLYWALTQEAPDEMPHGGKRFGPGQGRGFCVLRGHHHTQSRA